MAKHTIQDSVPSNADIPATPTVVTQAPHDATTSASNDVVLSQLHGSPLSLTRHTKAPSLHVQNCNNLVKNLSQLQTCKFI